MSLILYFFKDTFQKSLKEWNETNIWNTKVMGKSYRFSGVQSTQKFLLRKNFCVDFSLDIQDKSWTPGVQIINLLYILYFINKLKTTNSKFFYCSFNNSCYAQRFKMIKRGNHIRGKSFCAQKLLPRKDCPYISLYIVGAIPCGCPPCGCPPCGCPLCGCPFTKHHHSMELFALLHKL